MSDPALEGFFEAEPTAAAGHARELIEGGRAAELVREILHRMSGDSSWDREIARERLLPLHEYGDLLPPLTEALGDEGHAERRNAARSALAALASPAAAEPAEAIAWLTRLLEDRDHPDVRVLAASALGDSENPAARPQLETALHDPEPNVVSAAVDALGNLGDSRAVPSLVHLARAGEFWTRVAAVVALGRLRDRRALPVLEKALEESWLAAAAATALGEIGDWRALGALRRLVEARDADGSSEALRAAVEIVCDHSPDPPPDWLRTAAAAHAGAAADRLTAEGDLDSARLLGLAGTPDAARALVEALSDEGSREAASAAMGLLPSETATRAILARLSEADCETHLLLLAALPPLESESDARAVAAYLGYEDAEVRAAAAEALARSDEALVVPVIQEAVSSPRTQLGAALAYARLGTSHCQPLVGLLGSDASAVRAAAAEGLAHCGITFLEPLAEALRTEADLEARQAMVRALGTSGTEGAVQLLLPLLADEDPGVRFAAIQALGRNRHPSAFDPLVGVLADERPEMRAVAMSALGQIGDPLAYEPLARHLDTEERDLRRTAIFALDRLDLSQVGGRVVEALEDPDREVRLTAVRVLHRLGAAEQVSALRDVADSDPEAVVRREAARALADLQRTRSGEGR